MTSTPNTILADGRWIGFHGIGRFSREVLPRLCNTDILQNGPHPLSIKNLFWQSYYLSRKQKHQIFFTPGFNPVLVSSIPYVMMVHDLIHLHIPRNLDKYVKRLFYEVCMKPSIKKAYKIITVSDYSKNAILEWVGTLSPDNVTVIGNGVSAAFAPEGACYEPGFPYLLHVGNTKAHKNVDRLLEAFAVAHIDSGIKLIFTGQLSSKQCLIIQEKKLDKRVCVHTGLSEQQLAEYYRGALGVVFPSLYEGFGLPVIEGMASGVPVLTANVTSLPEVAAHAALLVDPYQLASMVQGIEQLVNNATLRFRLIQAGLKRAAFFSWDKIATQVQHTLDSAVI